MEYIPVINRPSLLLGLTKGEVFSVDLFPRMPSSIAKLMYLRAFSSVLTQRNPAQELQKHHRRL